jgi:hypothetical protein
MSLIRSVLIAFVVASAANDKSAAQEAFVPPAKISLPSVLSTTATGKSIAGQPWEYVVWQTSDYAWLKNRTLSIHIKPGAADADTSYTLLGTTGITTDPATLKVLLDRAKAIATNPEEANEAPQDTELGTILDSLCANWKVASEPVPATREGKLSALVKRALTHEEDASTLRQISISYPAVRMALGLGWAGPLPVPDGSTATIEVREHDPVAKMDLQVVGRVTFLAGRPVTLGRASTPRQVPDLTSEGNLCVKLRWAVDDTLRRQALQTTGFAVWRMDNAPAASIPTATEIANGFQLNRYPVDIPKLLTEGQVADFTHDPKTYFAIDRGTNNVVGAPGFTAEGTRYYCIAALDWLGQPGPVSVYKLCHIVKTTPPQVPTGLSVEERTVDDASPNQRRLRLTFDGNSAVPHPDVPAASRFAIYRGGGPQTTSLAELNRLLPNPELPIVPPLSGINPLVLRTATTGRMIYNDSTLQPTPENLSRSYWYSVRAIRDTALGEIYSAPSPPAFGTFRDREGPLAPDGSLAIDSPVTLVRYLSKSSETLTDGSAGIGNGRWLRVRCSRAGRTDIRSVALHLVDTSTGAVVLARPKVVFGNGIDEVYVDYFWYNPRTASAGSYENLTAVCTAESKYGVSSFREAIALTWTTDGGASQTLRTVVRFEAKVETDSQLNFGNVAPRPRMEALTGGYSLTNQGSSVTLTFNSAAWNGRKAIIRIVRSGFPDVVRLAKVNANRRVIFDDPRFTISGQPPGGYTIHFRKDTQSPMPVGFTGQTWLPSGKEGGHLSFSPVTGGLPSLWITLGVTPGSAEYRVYRQVDGGQMGLIAEGACDDSSPNGIPPQILVEEKPNIPTNAVVCYYGQLVDSSGNPSALKQIGECIPVIAPIAAPVVDAPEQKGTIASPQMTVKWFASKSGVKNFQVCVKEKATGAVLANPAGATKLPTSASFGVYFDKSPTGSLPEISIDPPIYVMDLLETPMGAVPPVPEEPAVFSLTYDVKPDTEYIVDVTAIDLAGNPAATSLPQKFTWRGQVASGSVPWPARPLPPVIDGEILGVRAISVTPSVIAGQGPANYYNADRLPVFVTIGLMPLHPTSGFTTEIISGGGVTVPEPAVPSLLADTEDKRYRGAQDPNAHLFKTISPLTNLPTPVRQVVLYRQLTATQGRDTSQTADVIQVSPLIQSIMWIPRSGGRQAFVDQHVVAFPVYIAPEFDSVLLGIADIHPILYGSTYRYFLVQFDATGEILQTIDAGTITTPSS